MSNLEDKREGAYERPRIFNTAIPSPKPGARTRKRARSPSDAATYNDEATLPEGLRRKAARAAGGRPRARQGEGS